MARRNFLTDWQAPSGRGAIFVLNALVESVLREFTVPAGLNMYFRVRDGDGDGVLRYDHRSRTRTEDRVSAPVPPMDPRGLARRTINFANQTWEVYFEPTAATRQDLADDTGFTVLILGLLTTAATAVYAGSAVRRHVRTEALVAARTDDLARAVAEAVPASGVSSRRDPGRGPAWRPGYGC